MCILFCLSFPDWSLLSCLTAPLFPLALAPTGLPAPSPPRTPHSNATLPFHPSPTRLLYQSKASMMERSSMQKWVLLKLSRQRQRAASHRLGRTAAAGLMAAAISFVRSNRWQGSRGMRDTDVTSTRSRERQNMIRPSACWIWTSSYLMSHSFPI